MPAPATPACGYAQTAPYSRAMDTLVRYFIRVPSLGEGSILGPFDPIQALQRAKQLRERGVEFFITNERGVVLVSEEEIKKFEG
jgi:hypothetical protein